ncbi:hypothetical protein [Primorskyibacter sp. 2E233]|uniref:hypothetical protein n=1 Tax=Primorskyibacter sp. 2E233 TaxID=3413431 RepID=UPI003BF06492
MTAGNVDRDNHVHFDEYEDVLTSLKMVYENLLLVAEEPTRWKWIVIGLHNALQGAAVCALTQTDGSGPWKKDAEKSIRKAYYGDHKVPDYTQAGEVMDVSKIAPFGELLRRLYPELDLNSGEDWFSAQTRTETSLRMLLSMRNDFQHFVPRSWSIEMAGLPDMVADAVDMIEEIALQKHCHRHNRFSELQLSKYSSRLRRQLAVAD